ncbi:hypothetical protein GGF32_007639 [Allomyces javanicus]|nr:hypothetical protein GGF32_007639 [Allomyces javanicus]
MASSFESTILTSGSGDDLLALVFPPTVHRVSLPSFAPPPQLAMVHASRSQSSLGELLTRPPNAPVPAPPGESSTGSAPDLSLPPQTPGGGASSTDALAGPPAHLMASMGCLQRDCNEPLFLETACRVLVPVPTPGASASTPSSATSPPTASPGRRLSGHLDPGTALHPRPISPAVSFVVHTMEFPATLEINDTTFYIRGDGFPEQTYQLPAARVSLESEPRVEIHEMNPPYRVLFESAQGSTIILLDSLVLFVDAIRKINRKLRIRKRIREDAAALKIQRAWRTHVVCTRYLRQRRAALHLQSWYRRHRLRHALLAHVAHLQRALSRRDQRARIINEMVTTEESYIQNLDVLVRVCLRPLRSLFRSMPGVPITAHHIDVIFGNVEAILDRHTEFYEALVAVTGLPTVFSPVDGAGAVPGRSWSPTGHIKDQVAASSGTAGAPVEGNAPKASASLAIETIQVKKALGQVFCDMATWLDVYIPYCNNYNDSKQELDRCLKVREFAGYLESVKSLKISQKNDLASFLILPVQRVPRYELLLKTLIRNTEPDDPELRALERALDRIHHAAQVINRAKMYNEARPHLHEIVKGMRKVALTTGTGPLTALGDATSELAALLNSSDSKGQFLGEGPAWYSTSRSAKAIAVYLYLFVGQLIVTVPKGGLLRGRSDNGAGAVGGGGGGPASSGAAVASTAAGLAKNSKLKFLAWIPLVHAQVFDSEAAPPTVASPSNGPPAVGQGFSLLDPESASRIRTTSESSASTTHSAHLSTSLPGGRSADPSPERSPSPARREHAFVIVESVAADPAEALLEASPMCHKFTVDSRDAKLKWVDQVSEAGMMAMLQPRSSELSPDFDKLHGPGSRPASPTDRPDRWWRMTPPRAPAANTGAAPGPTAGLGDDDQARTWLWRTGTAANASGPTRKPSSTSSARESSRSASPRGTLKRHSSQNSATKMGRSLGDLFSSAAHVSSSPIASTDDALAPSPPDASFRARSSSNASSTAASVVDSNLFRRASGRSPPKSSALAATAEEELQVPVPAPCALKERAQSTNVLVNSLESAQARHAAMVVPSNESLASSTASGGNMTIGRRSGGSGWRLGGSSRGTGGGGSLGAVGGAAPTKQRSLGNLMAFLAGGDRDKDKDKEGGGGGGGGSAPGSRPTSEDSVRGPSP